MQILSFVTRNDHSCWGENDLPSKMPRSPRLAHKVPVMHATLLKTFTRTGWYQWLSLATRNRRHLAKLHDDTVNLTWSIIIAHERITWHCRTSYLGGIRYESQYYGTINTRPTLFRVTKSTPSFPQFSSLVFIRSTLTETHPFKNCKINHESPNKGQQTICIS